MKQCWIMDIKIKNKKQKIKNPPFSSFIGKHKSEPDIYIGFSPTLHLQWDIQNHKFPASYMCSKHLLYTMQPFSCMQLIHTMCLSKSPKYKQDVAFRSIRQTVLLRPSFYLEENPYDSYKTGGVFVLPSPPPAMAAKETLSLKYF